jgi:hypothetical protein
MSIPPPANRAERSRVDRKSLIDWPERSVQVPLEIAFHNTRSVKWAEALIRTRVDELEEIYGRLISCRVRVDQRAKNTPAQSHRW